MSLDISFEAPAEIGIQASLGSRDSVISESFSAIAAQTSDFARTNTAVHEPVELAATYLSPDKHVGIRDIDKAGYGLSGSSSLRDDQKIFMGSNKILVTKKCNF